MTADDSDDSATVDGDPASYDEWLDAIAAGEGFYFESPAGVGSLPPRRVCPETGSTDLTREPLPEIGTIETYSVVHVATPGFTDDTPYISAIADFGPVRITGVVRGVDPETVDDLVGESVTVSVGTRSTTENRVVVLSPTEL
jgi:uncharacterized OB-fold protein